MTDYTEAAPAPVDQKARIIEEVRNHYDLERQVNTPDPFFPSAGDFE